MPDVTSALMDHMQVELECSRKRNREFAKAEFTNPIPQKIRRTKKYWIPQNKGHEFHNIFKFGGTTKQIIPTHVFFGLNRMTD